MTAAPDSLFSRRAFLQGFASAQLVAGMPCLASAGEEPLGALIADNKDLPTVSKRIAGISKALLGHRYEANTLIGGPRKAEVFVTRADHFDCMTFCETVLAAARARDLSSFETELRAIRYRGGAVEWRERNHDFAAWCERNIANGVCKPIALGAPASLTKLLTIPKALGKRRYSIAATSRAELIAGKDRLQDGDIIGFVSQRASLDYYHTGFVMFGAGGEFLLRNASESHGRVLDEPMQRFLAVNRVRYVTLLRPQELEKKEAEKKS